MEFAREASLVSLKMRCELALVCVIFEALSLSRGPLLSLSIMGLIGWRLKDCRVRAFWINFSFLTCDTRFPFFAVKKKLVVRVHLVANGELYLSTMSSRPQNFAF